MKPWLLAFLLLLAWTGNASAQNNIPADQVQLVQALLARVDQLEKRVAELESGKALPAVAAAPPAGEPMQMGPLTNPSVSQPSLNLAGFSDFTFAATDQKGIQAAFSEGHHSSHKFQSFLQGQLSGRNQSHRAQRCRHRVATSNRIQRGSRAQQHLDLSTTIISKFHLAVTTLPLTTGTPRFTMASGCKPQSAARK
jgi:hypothetical protein